MKLSDINPYVRFARENEEAKNTGMIISFDHRIFYCYEGSIKIEIDSKLYVIEKGAAILWHSALPYRYLEKNSPSLSGCNFDYTQKNSHINIAIPPGRTDTFDIKSTLETEKFDDADELNDVFVVKNAFAVADKFYEVVKEYQSGKLFFEQRCSAILKDIITTLVRISRLSYGDKASKLADEVLLYIRENYNKKLTNKDIGEHFNYNPNYINRLIIKNCSMSMHQYLMKYRINTAISLIQSTNMPISQIGEMVGMPDIKHFSKCFKQMTNASPSEYRFK